MKRSLMFAAAIALVLFNGATGAMANDLSLDRDGKVIALDHPHGYARPRQIYMWRDGAPVTIENPDASLSPRYVTQKFYPPNLPDVMVRIANGGAGAAGLFQALAYTYLTKLAKAGKKPDFAVAWYLTDTTYSLEALGADVVDIAVTYNKKLEAQSLAEGKAVKRTFAFMDHFMLVGPKDNPARIAASERTEPAFAAIIDHGCTSPFSGAGRNDCAYYLSRSDDSATDIKGRNIFDKVINASPRFASLRDGGYALTIAPWYFHCPAVPVACFPAAALQRANREKLYTLTDWGTWLANGGAKGVFANLKIFVTGRKSAGRPLLLNPAAALLSPHATPEAKAFYDWMLADDGGQRLIRTFGTAAVGQPLYVPAADTAEPE